jgi:hypothetical protein
MTCVKRCRQRLEAFEQPCAKPKHDALNPHLVNQTSKGGEQHAAYVQDEKQDAGEDQSAPSPAGQNVVYHPAQQQWHAHHQRAEREDAA